MGAAGVLGAPPSAETAWQDVLRLDAGPPPAPPLKSNVISDAPARAARERYTQHLVAQEKAVRRYLGLPGATEHAFEARFRLARILFFRADFEENPTLQQQATALLSALDATATPEQKGHIAFTRITQKMRLNRFPNKEQRNELLTLTRAFQKQFPKDPRVARLLVEVATQCDRDPALKGSLLKEASALTEEPQLRLRIADDLKRLALLGKPLTLTFPKPEGGTYSPADFLGVPLVILFYSEDSLPSLAGWETLNEALKAFPKFNRVAVSLDPDKASLQRVAKTYGDGWSLTWDGKGWDGPLARTCGVNAVPSAWLLDSKGRLLSLNLFEDTDKQLSAAAPDPAKP